jgi:hypothetical protein
MRRPSAEELLYFGFGAAWLAFAAWLLFFVDPGFEETPFRLWASIMVAVLGAPFAVAGVAMWIFRD